MKCWPRPDCRPARTKVTTMTDDLHRWRLILGNPAEPHTGALSADPEVAASLDPCQGANVSPPSW